ncbi:MAG TPA: Yip1 family protein [Verrucomicrobiae bacterium]|nr:Yip1 family protein [Verrucomicrobiae bacterium]
MNDVPPPTDAPPPWPPAVPDPATEPAAATEPVAAMPPPLVPPMVPAREPLNPWLSMWTRPRATMRQILDTNPRAWVHALAILGGVAEFLFAPIPSVRPLSGVSPGTMVVFKGFAGVAVGLIGLYFGSFLVWLTGRWIGGRGNFVEVRAASAWPNVLSLWGVLLWLPMLAYLGLDAFRLSAEPMLDDPVGMMLVGPAQFLGGVIAIWRFIVVLKCLGEAHGFSAWRALGAALLGGLLLLVPIAIVIGIGLGLAGALSGS